MRGLHVLGLAAIVVAAVIVGGACAGVYAPPPGDQQPVWSPDGTAIVYVHRFGGTRTFRVLSPDGSGDRPLPLPPLPDVGPTSFAFSPDWFWIAFGGHELVVSRPDGSARRPLSDISFGSPPAWSPDGRLLAFPRSDGIYVVEVDGSGLRRLTALGGFLPAWSPDGELIAFAGGVVGEPKLLTIRPDGSGERVLTEQLPGRQQQPVWSPDGSRIAFLSNPDGRAWRVTVATRDGRVVAELAPTIYASTIAWSPDGRRLLLSGSGVTVVDLESREGRQLVPFGWDALWSPTGGIVFTAGGECKDRTAIYRVDPDGGPALRLTNGCRIVGTAGPDRLVGSDLADVLLGLGGDDLLAASDGAYVADDLYGGAGDDVLTGDVRGDRLEGGAGHDLLEARAGHDFLRGGPGRDVLRGEGGKDQIRAEDGVRDVVSCGTNRLRSTGPELDSAFVDRLDRASGCELLYRNGHIDLRSGRTALTIAASRGGPSARWTLRCRPAGGTLPRAAAVCRRLARMRGPLAPVALDRFCAFRQDTGGASVQGFFAGRRLSVSFARSTACEVERWDRHAFLLEPR
jgi:Tol biopolymer transport system component